MSLKEKITVEIQNFALLAPDDANAAMTYVSESFKLCGFQFRIMLKERNPLKEINNDAVTAIEVLVDLVSTGPDAEELTFFVYESMGAATTASPSKAETEKTEESKVKIKRKLSNKILEAYEEIFPNCSKIELCKETLLQKAFRPVYTGSTLGSIGFDIEGIYDSTQHTMDIQLGSMEEIAQITTARPYTMKNADYPSSKLFTEGEASVISILTDKDTDKELALEINKQFETLTIFDNMLSPRKKDDFAQNSIDLFLDYIDVKKAYPSVDIQWTHKLIKNNVSVDSGVVSSSTWQAIKAITYMNADKYVIQKLLFDSHRSGEFDDMFDYCKVLVEKDEDQLVVKRVCCKGIWPTTPRDFVVSCTWHERRDGSIVIASRSICGQGMGHAEGNYPDHPGYVRGRVVAAGYLIQPYNLLTETEKKTGVINSSCPSVTATTPTTPTTAGTTQTAASPCKLTPCSPEGCKVTLCSHMELGGSLPSSIINMLSTGAPVKILESIRNIVNNTK